MALALLRIELRRSVAALLAPLILVLAWFYFAGSLPFFRAFLWDQASLAVRNTAVFAAPCLAGAAAWMAGRERRRGTHELLGTMPGGAARRQLAALLATAVWGMAVYLPIAAILVAITARHATWGGLILWPGLVGLLALGTAAALGFLLGDLLPGRFTAPAVAILTFVAQGALRYAGNIDTRIPADSAFNWLAYLSPIADLAASPWYGIQPQIGAQQAAFLLALAALAVAALVARDRRDAAAWLACGACALAVLAAVYGVYRAVPPGGRAGVRAAILARPTPYTPYCRTAGPPVCVHPAYSGWLDDNVALLARLMAPLADLPGGPARAEQPGPTWAAGERVVPLFPQPTDAAFARVTAVYLVRDVDTLALPLGTDCPARSDPGACRDAQDVVALWLLRQAGITPDPPAPALPRVAAAAARFGSLPEETRRAWLREHLIALREGQVPLDALP